MARYKLTKTEESQGDNHFYSIECIDEWDRWDGKLVSWDYEKIEEIVCALESIGSNGGGRHDFG